MKKIFIISFIILIIDIISKRLVIGNLATSESVSVIDNFFRITYAENTGVAFSLIEGYVGFIIMMTVIVIIMIFKYVKSNNINKYEEIGYSFILGGALGNLLDRVIYGYVIDFLDFNIFGYDFPIFNIADSFIVIGVFILGIISFREVGERDEVSSR